MTRIRLIISAVLLAALFSGCWPKVFNKREFSFYNTNSNVSLKTNGYYHSSHTKYGGMSVKIFLDNGFFHDMSASHGSNCLPDSNLHCMLKNVENSIRRELDSSKTNSNYILPNDKNWGKSPISLWGWGKYEVKENNIVIQYFGNRFGDYYLIEERGEVISDGSFLIKTRKWYYNNELNEVNELYKLKEFEVKNLSRIAPQRLNYPKLKLPKM